MIARELVARSVLCVKFLGWHLYKILRVENELQTASRHMRISLRTKMYTNRQMNTRVTRAKKHGHITSAHIQKQGHGT